jgi:vacuolar-type H+-ATPase subunit I/STV1
MKDGVMTITYEPEVPGDSYELSYKMDWTKSDVEALIKRYLDLEDKLRKFGQMLEELQDEDSRTEKLSAYETALWDVYMKPFCGQHAINSFFIMSCSNDEINMEFLTEMHEKYEKECLERLEFYKTSPADLIRAGNRLALFSYLKAPQSIINAMGCVLIEQMAIYAYLEKGAEVYSVMERIQDGLLV